MGDSEVYCEECEEKKKMIKENIEIILTRVKDFTRRCRMHLGYLQIFQECKMTRSIL